MKIQEVIDRALQDPQYAADLQAKALAAGRTGTRGQEFKDLLGEFASSPQELANFDRILNTGQDAVGTTTATATLTSLTITTIPCTTTTTTSTTTLTTGHLE